MKNLKTIILLIIIVIITLIIGYFAGTKSINLNNYISKNEYNYILDKIEREHIGIINEIKNIKNIPLSNNSIQTSSNKNIIIKEIPIIGKVKEIKSSEIVLEIKKPNNLEKKQINRTIILNSKIEYFKVERKLIKNTSDLGSIIKSKVNKNYLKISDTIVIFLEKSEKNEIIVKRIDILKGGILKIYK